MTGLTVAHPKMDNWTRTDLGFDEELGDANNRQRLLRQVALFRHLDDIDVASLAPGDFFGEMSLLTGEPRPAYNQAIAQTNDQELLLNLVRLRYRDNAYFTTVERIAAAASAGQPARPDPE